MSKVILSDKDFSKLKKVDDGDSDSPVVLSDKEFKELRAPRPSDTSNDSIIDDIMFIGEGIDRISGAPSRAAIMAASKGENPFAAFGEQFGEPTKEAPTGTDIMNRFGVSDEPLGSIEYTPEWGDNQEKYTVDFPSANKLGALAVDIFADPAILATTPFKAAQLAIKSSPRLQRKLLEIGGQKLLRTYLDDVPVGKIGKLMEKTGAERSVGNVLMEYNLGKHAGNPEKLLEEIGGKLDLNYQKIGGRQRMVGGKRVGGLVQKKKDEVDNIIKMLDRSEIDIDGDVFKGSRVADGESIMQDIMKQYEELATQPGQPFSPKDLEAKRKVLQQYLGKYSSKAQKEMFEGDVNPYMSFSDLNELKRGIGKRLREDIFKKDLSDKVAKEDEVLTKLYLYLKNTIEDTAKEFDPKLADQLINANMDSHAFQTLSTALEKIPPKELKKIGGVEAIGDLMATGAIGLTSYGVGAAIGEGVSTPLVLGLTGMYGASRGLPKRIGRSARNLEAKALQKLQTGNLIESPVTSSGVIGASLTGRASAVSQEPFSPNNREGREPQSVDPMRMIQEYGNVNYMVADTQIPRDTDWIKAHPKISVARIMQKSPDLAYQVQMALDSKNDTMLRKAMPIIAEQIPEIFEYDEYNAFDGKIIDPKMRRAYTDKIMADDDLDFFQKATIIDHLNRTKEVLR